VSTILIRNIVSAFFEIVYFLIFIRIIFSFFPINPYGSPQIYNIVQFIRQLTEPFLAPFRSLVPPLRVGGGGYMDLSPILAIIVLSLVRRLLLGLL
jgi:YggT family protein